MKKSTNFILALIFGLMGAVYAVVGGVTLKSRRLWHARSNPGDAVEVVYDPMDEKKYVMLFEGE